MSKWFNWKWVLHLIVTILCIVFFYYITTKTRPFPISDFLYYWNYVDNLAQYYKGGLLFLPYLPLKLSGLEPYISAFIVNSLCFIGLSYTFWLGNKTKLQYLSTLLLALTGIWFAGYIPIVNSDIPTITIWLLGVKLFSKFLSTKQNYCLILAIIFFAFSLSLRSQLYYICIILLIITFMAFLFSYKKFPQGKSASLKFLSLFLTASIIISFSATKLLELQSADTKQIQLNKRVTVYTGLLETFQDGIACGGWNPDAVQRAKDEINTPIVFNIIKGVREIPVEQLINTISCKWKNYMFEYNQSGLSWLEVQISEEETIKKDFDEFLGYYKHIEYFAANLLKLSSFSLILLFINNIKKYQKAEIAVFLITTLILLLFFLIHTILELQPRYIIPPVMIALVLSLYLHSGVFKNLNP